MDTAELLKKVRRVEIKTRGLSQNIFSGEYHSAFKGRGMAFSEVREYMPGDEIRTIDWNVTARLNTPYVKVFEEERELNVMLLIDISCSGNFGTQQKLKKEIIAEVSAVLSFSAINNNDKIGVIFFTDKIEKFIPPKKGKSHILRIIRDLIEFEPDNDKTDITEALKYLTNAIKKRSIAFIISDFISADFEKSLKIANNKHDVIAIRIFDKREYELPPIGIAPFMDAETKELVWINTNRKSIRERYNKKSIKRRLATLDTFKKAGVDYTEIATDHSYVRPLMMLFKKREMRR